MGRTIPLAALAAVLSAGCPLEPSRPELQRRAAEGPTPDTTTPTPSMPAAPSPPLGVRHHDPVPGVAPSPTVPPPTAEELALIEKDPKDLSVEDRRRRAHALRKKILQNPDSPSARSLEDMRKAVEAGDLAPELPDEQGSLRLHAPGTAPTPRGPPVGTRTLD